MAKVELFPEVQQDLADFGAAFVKLQKSIARCAEKDDGVRLSKIAKHYPDMAGLHGTLKAIRTTELSNAGLPDLGTLGGGITPED